MLKNLGSPLPAVRLQPPEPACRLCGARLPTALLDLGRLPLAGHTVAAGEPASAYPLRVRVCESCLLVQIDDAGIPNLADGPMPGRSTCSTACQDHARRLATTMRQRLGLGAGSMVIEVASRGGTLLRHFHAAGAAVLRVGSPAQKPGISADRDIPIEGESLNTTTAMGIAVRHGRADLVVASNVLPEVADLFDFAAGCASILRPKGIVVFQFPWLLSILQKVQFDAFRHNRFTYLSLFTLERVLRPVGLRVFDAEPVADHGGSLRVYACHSRGPHAARPALKAARQAEAQAQLDQPQGYAGFDAKVDAAIRDVRDFLGIRRAAERSVAAWGATGRGASLLNACGIKVDQVAWVADPDPAKQSRLLPHSRIPIIAPAALLAHRPDDVLILPWPNAAEIAAGLLPLRQRGTQFWVASPAIRRV